MIYRIIESCIICGDTGRVDKLTRDGAERWVAKNTDRRTGVGHTSRYRIEEVETMRYYITASETKTLELVVEAASPDEARSIARDLLDNPYDGMGVVMKSEGRVEHIGDPVVLP